MKNSIVLHFHGGGRRAILQLERDEIAPPYLSPEKVVATMQSSFADVLGTHPGNLEVGCLVSNADQWEAWRRDLGELLTEADGAFAWKSQLETAFNLSAEPEKHERNVELPRLLLAALRTVPESHIDRVVSLLERVVRLFRRDPMSPDRVEHWAEAARRAHWSGHEGHLQPWLKFSEVCPNEAEMWRRVARAAISSFESEPAAHRPVAGATTCGCKGCTRFRS